MLTDSIIILIDSIKAECKPPRYPMQPAEHRGFTLSVVVTGFSRSAAALRRGRAGAFAHRDSISNFDRIVQNAHEAGQFGARSAKARRRFGDTGWLHYAAARATAVPPWPPRLLREPHESSEPP
jgi:hypothetical protein